MDAILVVRGKDASKGEFHRELQSLYYEFPIGKLLLSLLGMLCAVELLQTGET